MSRHPAQLRRVFLAITALLLVPALGLACESAQASPKPGAAATASADLRTASTSVGLSSSSVPRMGPSLSGAGTTRIAKGRTDFWAAARCTAAITLLVAGVYFTGYRLYRVIQAVRVAGGIAAVVQAVLVAATLAGRIAAFNRIFGSLAQDVLGITAIRTNCLG